MRPKPPPWAHALGQALMSDPDQAAAPSASPGEQRQELLTLLRQEPRGSARRQQPRLMALIKALERATPADLKQPETLAQLEGVWELRWSSSQQPYLAVGPWLENLQLLAPSLGRGMNLLRLPGPLATLAAIAVEASIALETSETETSENEGRAANGQQRVRVCFERGGWLGPSLGAGRLQLLRRVQQSFPAWLAITVLDDELRICRGQAGTLFALIRRPDLSVQELLLPAASATT